MLCYASSLGFFLSLSVKTKDIDHEMSKKLASMAGSLMAGNLPNMDRRNDWKWRQMMENEAKYFERAIEILFEAKERDFRKILYKVAAIYPRALVEAKDGVVVTPEIPSEIQDGDLLITGNEDICPPYPHQGSNCGSYRESGATLTEVVNQHNIVGELYDAGYTTAQIAKAARVSHTTVYKWKHKTKRPSKKHADLLEAFADGKI